MTGDMLSDVTFEGVEYAGTIYDDMIDVTFTNCSFDSVEFCGLLMDVHFIDCIGRIGLLGSFTGRVTVTFDGNTQDVSDITGYIDIG